MSTATIPQTLPLSVEDRTRVCAILAARMEAVLRREHARVLYYEAMSRQLAQGCTKAKPWTRWMASFGLAGCPVTQKCVSDMAASVTMALHLMQMELLENLGHGEGMDHPLTQVLVDRMECEHDDVMRAMRLFCYDRFELVREGLAHHEAMSHVALRCSDIERWIERQSRMVDGVVV